MGIKLTTANLSKAYTQCATENSQCSFNGKKSVAFATPPASTANSSVLNTSIYYTNPTNGVACTVAGVGSDPAVGLAKQCFVADIPNDITFDSKNAPNGFTQCATENASCVLPTNSGQYDLLYTANGAYTYANVTGNSSMLCNTANFADPASGAAKSCYYRTYTPPTATQTTPVTTPTSSTTQTTSTGLTGVQIGLIVMGVIIFLLVIACIIYIVRRKGLHKRFKPSKINHYHSNLY